MNARALRWLLAGVAALDSVGLAFVAHREGLAARARGASSLAVSLSAGPVVAVVAGLSGAALLAFGRRRAPIPAGLAALAGMAVLEHTQAALFASHQRMFFASGATLAGWLFGLAFARQLPDATPESSEEIARWGGLAALAATYVDAGVSKLANAGLAWAGPASLRVAILVNHPVDDATPFAAYASWLVRDDRAAAALSTLTLALELGAFAVLVGPRIRRAWALLLVGFHVNVALLAQDIFYVQASVLLLAFSVPRWTGPRPAAAGGGDGPRPDDAPLRAAAARSGRWIAAAIAAVWLARWLGVAG